MPLTAAYTAAPKGGYTASIKAIPGAISEGETLDEARENLADALRMVLECNRGIARRDEAVREQSVLGERTPLIPLLQNLADALEIVPGVTAVDLAGTGFELWQSNHHTSLPPDMPTGLHLKYPGILGQLQVLLSAVARAMFYEVEYTLDPVNGPWTAVPAFGSTRGIVLTGLTRGKDYYVRVRAVAAGQNRGPWSDIATTMAM